MFGIRDFFSDNIDRKKEERLLKIGEIANKAGVLPSTIRFYCNVGILKVTEYSKGGYRLFDERETMERLKKIKELVEKRLTLEEIRRWLS